jgi:hypothetical protein
MPTHDDEAVAEKANEQMLLGDTAPDSAKTVGRNHHVDANR